MAYYLGLDAGGTTTRCAVGDETRILAEARSGSIKHMRVGPTQAAENLRSVVAEALRKAGLRSDQIAASCVGIAGSRIPSVVAWVKQELASLATGTIDICGDEVIALDDAFHGDAGVLIVAGTGSNAIARTISGHVVNAGGWGPALGDEGSGYWIGHAALAEACRAYDRGQPSMLLERIAAFWKVPGLGELVAQANQTPAPDFSLLAPLVSECAEAGDEVATTTLLEAGRHLAEFALLAHRKARALDPEAPTPAFSFTGSVVENIPMVREAMIDHLRQALPTAVIAQEAANPLLGALWRARQAVARG